MMYDFASFFSISNVCHINMLLQLYWSSSQGQQTVTIKQEVELWLDDASVQGVELKAFFVLAYQSSSSSNNLGPTVVQGGSGSRV